jgi:hypothetical protein
MRVTKFNTLLRVAYTLCVYLIWTQVASAQTVLNFAKATLSDRLSAGFAVINPTSNYADVQFTYYGLDGNPVSSGLVNPVRYRVAPKGQISMRANELFAGSRADGWVQVTSPTTGLTGFYLEGDFSSSLEGSDSAAALSTQIVPVIRDDTSNKTELDILNPGTAPGTVAVTLFNASGAQVGSIPSQVIPGHGALRLPPSVLNAAGLGTLSARITASIPVGATAVIDRGDSLLFASGQAVDQTSTVRIAPHFITSGGFDPVLVLTNPAASDVSATVTVFTDAGDLIFPASASSRTFRIPANGSLSADIRTITGQPIGPTVNGWLRIDSANIALPGLVILDEGQAVTSVPLQNAPIDRMIFSEISETQSLFTGLALVNPASTDATLDVALVRSDGSTFAEDSVVIPANSKLLSLLRDLVPDALGQTSGYVVIRSSTPLFGVGLLGAANNSFLASMSPSRMPDAFAPSPMGLTPAIVRVDPGTDVQPGMTLRVSLLNALTDPTFLLGGQALSMRQVGPIGSTYEVTVPPIELGSANLTVRSNGLESPPVSLRVLPADNSLSQTMAGQAFYQKVDVTDAGLDLNHPTMVPIRNARVEIFSRSSQSVVAVSETDLRGRFTVPVPLDPNLTVRVLSRLRSLDLRVADNTNQNQLYSIALDVDGRESRSDLVLADSSRLSGAYNILEMVQRGNDTIRMADPTVAPPVVTIYWSTRNRKSSGNINNPLGLVGTTYFNIATNTAYVLGDRNDHGADSDSDEFDDAVIVHEYAHMLAAKFSRDDSPGGQHMLGDMLDPRVAWSEGWANFFSSVVRNDAIWRDSFGANGTNILRYDLEDNVPAGDKPGYWSEASVDTILWDLFDDHVDTADNVQYPFSQIWNAFTDLRNDRFVYLPYFLEHFVTRNPAAADDVRGIVQARSIDFQPNVRPSVAYPFPAPMNDSTVTGVVDSLTTKRTNLVNSSHFYSFTTAGGAASIRLDITGLGTGGNPNANDLDLFLMDSDGNVIARSDSGLNGQTERVALKLAAGTYVVEIRSYYTKAETGGFVFNSGDYRLNVSVQ